MQEIENIRRIRRRLNSSFLHESQQYEVVLDVAEIIINKLYELEKKIDEVKTDANKT